MLHAWEHESRETEVTKLIHEGMDPADAQDLVDARLPEDPESGSDGEEEEEELEPLGGRGSGLKSPLVERANLGSPSVPAMRRSRSW